MKFISQIFNKKFSGMWFNEKLHNFLQIDTAYIKSLI